MIRVAIIIGIALALWGLYKISSTPPTKLPAPSEVAAPQKNETPTVVKPETSEAVPPKDVQIKSPAPTEAAPTIDPQKKAELLKKQSVFKGVGN